jgi:DNA-binding beta-propeller fold protein YncE/thiol-disulfide isomerase/thioredoxin
MKKTISLFVVLMIIIQLFIFSGAQASNIDDATSSFPLVLESPMPVRTYCHPTVIHSNGSRLLVCDQGRACIQNIFLQNDYRFGVFGIRHGQIHTPGDITLIDNKPYVTDTVSNKVLVYKSNGNFDFEFRVYNSQGSALLNRPKGIDTSGGRIYIANSGGSNIVVCDTKGSHIFTIESEETEPAMEKPTGVASSGDRIYITDPSTESVYLFNYDGEFISRWNVDSPWAIVVDEKSLFLTSSLMNTASEYDLEGNLVKVFSKTNEGKQVLEEPQGIGILDGRIIVSSKGTDQLELWNRDGSYAGVHGEDIDPLGSIVEPSRITIKDNQIYIADSARGAVVVFSKNGKFIKEIGHTSNFGLLDEPSGVAVDSIGNIYVSDLADDDIKVFDSDGLFQSSIGARGSDNGQLMNPSDVCVDPIKELLYISDTDNHRIQVFSTKGEFINTIGGWGTAPGEFILPKGLSLIDDTLAVADFGNCRIQIISTDGKPINTYGKRGTDKSGLMGPVDCSFDNDGKVFIADSLNHRLVVYDPVTGFEWNYGDCGGPYNQYHMIPAICPPKEHDSQAPGFFMFPTGIVTDSFGCFVADSRNSRIQFVDYTEIFSRWDYILSPSIINFGVIPSGSIVEKTVEVKNISGGTISGIIEIDQSVNWLKTRSTSFLDDDEPISLIANTKSLESGVYETDVNIITNKDLDGKPTIVHVKLTVGESYSYCLSTNPIIYRHSNSKIIIPIEIQPQNGFSSTVALSVTNTPPRTYGQFDKSLVELTTGDSLELLLTLRSSNPIKPGIYGITIVGQTPRISFEIEHTFYLVISSDTETEPRTVLGETFTAEWCINCPYAHRAAERLVEEYGRSNLLWLNYYVETAEIDEAHLYYPPADIRYKWYPGQGLPTTFFDGYNSVVGGDNHEERKTPPDDRLPCDKFSGTTFTYERYKAECEGQLSEPSPLSLFLDTQVIDRMINARIEMELLDTTESYKQLTLYVVLSEDNIEFPALNKDEYHNLICREMYTGPKGEEIILLEGKVSVKEMQLEIPEYVNINNASLVVWVQSNSSKQILQSTSNQFHSQPMIDSYVITTSNDQIDLEVDGDTEFYYNITNTSSYTLKLDCNPLFNAEGWDYVVNLDGSEVNASGFTISIPPFMSKRISVRTSPPVNADPGMTASFEMELNTHKHLSKSNTINLRTIPRLPPDFTVEPNIKRVSITKDATEEFMITFDPINDFMGPVTLTDCTNDPSLQVRFDPPVGVPPFDTKVTVTGGVHIKPKDYDLCIVAKGISSIGDEIEHKLELPVDVKYTNILINASPLKIISCSENESCHSASVDILIDSPIEVSNIEFSIRYDPSVLTVTHHNKGTFFETTTAFNFIDRSTEGKISTQITGNPTKGTGKLCTVVMRGVKGVTQKDTSIEVCEVVATDSNGDMVLSISGCTRQTVDVISHLNPPILTVDADDGIYVDQEQYILNGASRSSDPDYPVTVTINGRVLNLTSEGKWNHTVRLREGPNTFVIISSDDAGTSTAKKITINRDSTPPSVGVSNFRNGQITSETSVELVCWVDEYAEVTVNGNPVELSEFNEFTVSTTLKEGENSFIIKATDRMGRETVFEFELFLVRSVKIELWINRNSMIVNGVTKTLPQAPILTSPPLPPELAGNTYMPIREVAESLYAKVAWDGNERKVTLSQNIKGKLRNIELWIGKQKARVNGKEVWIDDSQKLYPTIVSNKTMLPLRFVSENLGADVEWIGQEKKIILKYQP